jgi:hypothetical protein
MDNASNNDTLISALQSTLTQRGIEFSGSTQRIRYVYNNNSIFTNFFFFSCFPHIINLACKAMLDTWSGIEFNQDSIRKLRKVIQSVSVLIF